MFYPLTIVAAGTSLWNQREIDKCRRTFIDFAEIVAIGDAVKHALRIAAIRIQFGTKSNSVRDHARVFSGNGARLLREHCDSSLSDPRLLREFLVLTQTLIVRRRCLGSQLKLHDVDASFLHRQAGIEIISTMATKTNPLNQLNFKGNCFVFKTIPLSPSVDDEPALIVRQSFIIHHTFESVGLEVAQVLVDERVVFDVGILPLAMSP